MSTRERRPTAAGRVRSRGLRSAVAAGRRAHPASRNLDEHDPSVFERASRAVGLVVAPITLITALLFYVGWVRTFSFFRLFGVNVALLRYSNQDFMLRSVDSIYHPLGLTLGFCLAGFWLHAAVRRWILRSGSARVVGGAGGALFVLGAAGLGVAALTVVRPSALPVPVLVTPVLGGAGIVLATYGNWLLRCRPGTADPRHRRLPGRGSPVELTLVLLLLVLCLFWATSEYVAATARGRAQNFAARIAAEPSVVVYSDRRLFLAGPGVREEALPDEPTAAYRYRYSGLRLLVESQGRYFLLPVGWAEGAATLMLDHGPGLRIEFSANG